MLPTYAPYVAARCDLGYWELEDMVAARDWLVQQGIADPDRILPSGRSYGGYLTLLALGKRPDLWAGGMASVAISDWTMLYEDSPETRGYCAALFGGTPTRNRSSTPPAPRSPTRRRSARRC